MFLSSKYIKQRKCQKRRLLLHFIAYLHIKKKRGLQNRKVRSWISEIVGKRPTFGTYHHLMKDLKKDDEKFVGFFRVNKQQFEHILDRIENDVTKLNTSRESISAEERLAVTLR